MRSRIAVGVVVAVAVVACRAPEVGPENAPAPASAVDASALARIAALEDARTGGSELAGFLTHRQALVRQRAASALARLWFPEQDGEVTRALLGARFDADEGVRADAAFALGVRGDPSASEALVSVALGPGGRDRSPVVRARAIESASKLDRPELRQRLLDGLSDPDPRVRLEAAAAPLRWPADETLDKRLVEHLASEKHRDVITYALAALERRKSEAARDVFLRFAKSEDVEQRIFAVRGLARIAPSDASRAALVEATKDTDWRVACEAVLGLGASTDDAVFAQLAGAAQHANAHVRRCAWDAITSRYRRLPDVHALDAAIDTIAVAWPWNGVKLPGDSDEDSRYALAAKVEFNVEQIATAFRTGKVDDSFVNEMYSQIRNERRWLETSPTAAAGFARGLGELAHPVASTVLTAMASEGDLAARQAAIEALANRPSTETRSFLHGCLADPDNGIRLAAVNALVEMPDASDVEPLARCYESSTGDGANEIRFGVLRALGKIGGDEAKRLLALGAADPHPFVRRVAREELAKLGVEVDLRELAPVAIVPRAELPPIDTTINAPEPRVEVVTSRGTMVFELFPREAPVHVHNFLTLAERGHYDGLTFHRVVPDFVIQGGDYRGDGNGGGTWRARDDALRHEFTPRKYVRGSLGMPRNDDPDSGGSQFFVTHRATPHLDGRYTLFGELREGFDVLDAIEVGDTIVRVRSVR